MGIKKRNKIIEAGIGYTIGSILIKGISFFSIPIFTRILTQEEYGLYTIYQAYHSIVYILLSLGISNSIRNFYIDSPKTIKKYVASLMDLLLLVGITGIILGYTVQKITGSNLLGNSSIIYLLIFQASFCNLIELVYIYYGTFYKYKSYLLVSLMLAIGEVILAAALIKIHFFQNGFMERVVGGVVPMTVIGVVLFLYFTFKEGVVLNIDYWKYACKIGLPIVVFYLAYSVLNASDRIMVQKYCGAVSAAIYGFVNQIGMIINIIIKALFNAWTPWFYEQMGEKNYHQILEKHKIFLTIFSFIFTGFILVIPEFMKLFTPSSYWDGIKVVAPVCMGTYFVFVYNFFVYKELFYKKPELSAIGTIIAALINIVLNVLLIPKFGYEAAAYTTVVSFIALAIIHKIFSDRLCEKDTFSNRFTLQASGICMFVCILQRLIIHLPLIRWTVAAIVGIILLKYFKKYGKQLSRT